MGGHYARGISNPAARRDHVLDRPRHSRAAILCHQRSQGYLGLGQRFFLFIWLGTGFFSLWLHNDLLPWIFFFYSFWLLAVAAYKYKNNKKVEEILSGADVMQLIFERKLSLKKQSIFSRELSWLVMTLFPIPFLLYYLDWKMITLYLVMGITWHIHYFKLRK